MEKCVSQSSSYLSSNVKKIVCFQVQPNVQNECCENIFLGCGVLNWKVIEKACCLDKCFSKDGMPDYLSTLSHLYPVSCQIHANICQLSTKEFELKYENHLQWTTKSKLLFQCFNLLKSPQPGSLVTSLLLLTSTLERILGDIYLMCSDGDVTCPSLLKDLLRTGELKSVLGESLMCCFDVYIGSPNGLNLRNLAWHGFLSEGELQAHYVSFLLMLTISLAETMKFYAKQPLIEKLNERPLITYSELAMIKDVFPVVNIEHLSELFSASDFVTTSMAALWYLAADFFQQNRFDYVVMILLPQLEHSLRRLYASVNEMPERLQTAESARFYTTFNEILYPTLANGARNQLLDCIGPSFTELLLDILVHPKGPRLRDHLSHGELDTIHFPKCLANHILCIAVVFCVRFSFGEKSKTVIFSEISSAVQDYASIFHPFSCFRRDFASLVHNLIDWKNLNRPSDDDFCSGNDKEDFYDKNSWQKVIGAILEQSSLETSAFRSVEEYAAYGEGWSLCDEDALGRMLRLLSDSKMETLFRPRYELEKVVLLRQIVDHCLRTSEQMQQTSKERYSEWKRKVLRSRQRNNYKRFWVHLPFIGQTLCLLSLVVVSEFINIKNTTDSDVKKSKFLKKCLQRSENLASLSSSSRNRWLECKEVGEICLNEVCTYYGPQNFETGKYTSR